MRRDAAEGSVAVLARCRGSRGVARPGPPPAGGVGGTPGGDRGGVRLGRERARYCPAARRPARGRQAGDPARAAARQRPGLGRLPLRGQPGARRPRPARTLGERLGLTAIATADVGSSPGWRCRARTRPAAAAAGTNWALAVLVGTFTCVLRTNDEVGVGLGSVELQRPAVACAAMLSGLVLLAARRMIGKCLGRVPGRKGPVPTYQRPGPSVDAFSRSRASATTRSPPAPVPGSSATLEMRPRSIVALACCGLFCLVVLLFLCVG